MWSQFLKLGSPLKPDHIEFIFTNLLPAAMHKDPNIRSGALKVIKETLPVLQKTEYRSHPGYQKFLKNVIGEFMPKVKGEIETNPDWHSIWSYYLTVTQKDMARTTQINTFLSVAEQGFRSNNSDTRVKSFQCWHKLIEVFSNEGQLIATKRLKLITLPLIATASRNVELAIAKFSCWWYLINNVKTENCEEPSICFFHFLNFCFGPLNGKPLASYEPMSSTQAVSPGKLYAEMRLPVVVALIKLLGNGSPLIHTLNLKMDLKIVRQLDINKVYVGSRQEIVNSCAEATVLVYRVYNLTADQQVSLTRNIWTNLFAIFHHDDKILKSIILTMDALRALVETSADPERKPIRAAIQIILETFIAAQFDLKKGADFQIEFSRLILRGLVDASSVMDKSTIENTFRKLVAGVFNNMILLDNKMNFVAVLGKCLMEAKPTKCDFTLWSLFWGEVVIKLEQLHPLHLELLEFALQNYFNKMVRDFYFRSD